MGWPADWDKRKRGADCPMCAALGEGDNKHGLIVAELEWSEVRLGRHSLLPGYCSVTWRHGHVSEIFELDETDALAYWRDVRIVAGAIDRAFTPMKVNLLTLGNWVPHLHTHVLPRYVDDPAPGGRSTGPMRSMPTRSTTRTSYGLSSPGYGPSSNSGRGRRGER